MPIFVVRLISACLILFYSFLFLLFSTSFIRYNNFVTLFSTCFLTSFRFSSSTLCGDLRDTALNLISLTQIQIWPGQFPHIWIPLNSCLLLDVICVTSIQLSLSLVIFFLYTRWSPMSLEYYFIFGSSRFQIWPRRPSILTDNWQFHGFLSLIQVNVKKDLPITKSSFYISALLQGEEVYTCLI